MAFTDTAGSSHNDTDDISLFLRQLLQRSSSSSSSTPIIPPSTFPSVATHAGDQHQHLTCFSSLPITTVRTPHQQIPNLSTFFSGCRSSDDTLNRVVLMAPAARFPISQESNLNSSESFTGSAPVRSLENEYGEDYDCESEEGGAEEEEEADLRLPLSRNQSKRSRAAEVHNLSEKRRRSRINEKMKALQNLIPNSNKTDKASMLDEAIEYLKQLQLQVQMLSTRNGLSLHPLCVPQIGLDYVNKARSVGANMPNELNMLSTRPSLPDSISSVMNSEVSSYGLEDSYTHDNFGPFHIRNYPQAVCREQNEKLVPSNAQTEIGVVTTTAFDTRNMDVRSQQNYGLQEMLP